MDAAAQKQIKEARQLGAKVQFILEPRNGGLTTLHSYADLDEGLLSSAISGHAQVYDTEDPRRLVSEPMYETRGAGLDMTVIALAVDRALTRFRRT